MRAAAVLIFSLVTFLGSSIARADEQDDEGETFPSSEPAAPPRPPEAVVAPKPRAAASIHAHAAGGASYGSLFGIGMTAARLEVGAVIDVSRRAAVTLGAGADLGSTEAKLPMGDFDLFASVDFVYHRVRVGAGPQISYFFVSRATAAPSRVEAFGVGVRSHVTLDVIRFHESRAVTLAIVPEAEWLWSAPIAIGSGGGLFRVAATTGVRF